MTTPAIILARSGSKGCPDKNKRLIAGRPCYQWSVLDAQAANCRVIVTSDDQDILTGACAMGCEVVLRPSELATDTATVQDSVRHACHAKGIDTGPVVVLYGCVPVRPKHLISGALAVLESTGADSVQSYCPVGKCHPEWMQWVRVDGTVHEFRGAIDDPSGGAAAAPHRRQDLYPLFIPDGGVIVVRHPGHDERDYFFGPVRQSITTRPGDVIDVDTEHDAMVAECVLERRARSELRKHAFISERVGA